MGPELDLLDRTYRANPGYQLVMFDRLPFEQQQAMRGLKDDRDFYGLLLASQSPNLRPKAVSQQTALLFLTLQQPGRMPFYVLEQPGSEAMESVAQLVMDGVLEVEVGDGFVSGALAHGLLFSPRANEKVGPYLDALSRQAVVYAESLEGLGTSDISARLYLYNRVPASPFWRSRFSEPGSVSKHWGIDRGLGRLPGGGSWYPIEPPDTEWLSWRQQSSASPGLGITYKLYVSPEPDHAPMALAETVRILSAVGAPCFKIGANLRGLLRPDKLVCYFDSFKQMCDASSQLAPALNGLSPQGVPFTSEISDDGLVSWGVDPAPAHRAFGWLGRQSWRLWITNHLASSLVAARSSPSNTPGSKFALDRLSLEGVDIRTWAPTDVSRLNALAGVDQEAGAWR